MQDEADPTTLAFLKIAASGEAMDPMHAGCVWIDEGSGEAKWKRISELEVPSDLKVKLATLHSEEAAEAYVMVNKTTDKLHVTLAKKGVAAKLLREREEREMREMKEEREEKV